MIDYVVVGAFVDASAALGPRMECGSALELVNLLCGSPGARL